MTYDSLHVHLFHEGTDAYAYRYMGAHREERGGCAGFRFAVWAPNAKAVGVAGDFNGWRGEDAPMQRLTDGGIWETWLPIEEYTAYQYAVQTPRGGWQMKADPFAFHTQTPPSTASRVYDPFGFTWHDDAWMTTRGQRQGLDKPMNIYEVHLGSWRRDEEGRLYTYKRMADELIPYCVEMGYTHIEMMPIMEHPLDLSWGYQITGYYAPSSRFGSPEDFAALIDCAHQAGLGVLLDWVPSHFPKDAHGLRRFDGTALYEHRDKRRGDIPEWGTHMFNYGRNEVRSFLISNALFWLEVFHADGLRVDAVSYMLYNDLGRKAGEWLPNQYGGNQNIEAIGFLRQLNTTVYSEVPDAIMAAEEASSWPMVTMPPYVGGLGFGYKWNMGWLNDYTRYVKLDPAYRKYHHGLLTFSLMYAFNENYMLPFSHDEVVHGKLSMLNRHPGDYWQKFAGLRASLGYQMAHPGKKLLFMGGEFGQFIEWKELEQLDWFLLSYPMHDAMRAYVKALNRFYLDTPALWQIEDSWAGFAWLAADDIESSVLAMMRTDKQGGHMVAVINFTPVYHAAYRVGIMYPGMLYERFNSDDPAWGGSGQGNPLPITVSNQRHNQFAHSFEVSVPPLGCVFLWYEPIKPPEQPKAPAASQPRPKKRP